MDVGDDVFMNRVLVLESGTSRWNMEVEGHVGSVRPPTGSALRVFDVVTSFTTSTYFAIRFAALRAIESRSC
jgi:hypothetical protein